MLNTNNTLSASHEDAQLLFFNIPRPNFGQVREREEEDSANSFESNKKVKRIHPFDSLGEHAISALKKQSQLIYCIFEETLFFRGEAYPLIRCAENDKHKIFSFRDEQVVRIHGEDLKTSKLLVKLFVYQQKDRNFRERYHHERQNRPAEPRVYYASSLDEKDMFWIVEKKRLF